MKIICKSDTQVFGYGIVSKGEAIEWPDGRPFPPHVQGNFKSADGKPLCNASPKPPEAAGDKPQPPEAAGDKPQQPEGNGGTREPTAEEKAAEQGRAEKTAIDELVKRTAALGKQKLIAALDASGVTYSSKATCEELAKALLRSQGQEID